MTQTLLPMPRGFAGSYTPGRPGCDEMLEPDGSLRAPWRTYVAMMDDMGAAEIASRAERARRQVRENGTTYNVYGEPDGLDRAWSLDMVPLLLPEQQWQEVQTALVQRARLMDLLLADLYGPRTSLSAGLLPAELIYANEGFLRACHGVTPPQNRWLHLYAADIARGPDGAFRVMSDRTQAPSGAGYALENRIVVSRMLPTVFRQCNVMRLAPFFITLRKTLASLAPAERDNPNVVLLTPGPYNETYFEHAYLARYLGYTLVQGNDLTVRDGRVYLKMLGGLQRVHVILRRVDDDFCDPLELYARSFLGVPGLMQAVRDGNVAVANALGSGVLQAPALLAFLPVLCRHLLGEELRMASVQTWWCGDPQSLAYVQEHLRELVIKPAFPSRGGDPIFGEALDSSQLDELRGRIAQNPAHYAAQEHLASHTAPVLQGDQLQSRRYVLRTYLAASNDTYEVMSGGMTRVTESPESLIVSLQRGGGTKDTWVVSDRPVSEITLLASTAQPVELSRGGGDLPSRVADDLFWLGRYIERTDGTVRLARTLLTRLMDPNATPSLEALAVLARSLDGRAATTPGALAPLQTARAVAANLLSDASPTSLRSILGGVHHLARALRDRISADGWRILQSLAREWAEFKPGGDDDDPSRVAELCNRLVTGFLAFGGIAADSMTRGQAWRFLDMGRRIERGVCLANLLRSTLVLVGDDETPLLDALLDAADSALTYRRRYLTQLEARAVVDLLLADDGNPRAIAYQIIELESHLAHLPRDHDHPSRSPDRQLALELRSLIQLADLTAASRVIDRRRSGLDRLTRDVAAGFGRLSDILGQMYFSHALVSRSLHGGQQERTL